jgi:hypothetical protein
MTTNRGRREKFFGDQRRRPVGIGNTDGRES